MRPTEGDVREDEEEGGLATIVADRDLLDLDLRRLWHDRNGDRLNRISEYALLPAGKLLRPLLLVESARCVGAPSGDLTEVALAVEYLHVATLVHDDIIDNDDVRRGRPSVQAAFGVADAIVTGDGLIFEAFTALAAARRADVPDAAIAASVAILASAGMNLCRGQMFEAELVGDLDCSVAQYLQMAGLKTGELFEAACRIGAILGGADPVGIDALGMFGSRLGSAFQIRDDLLTFDSTRALTGKPTESDLRNQRPTLPLLLAYQRADAAGRRELERPFSGAPVTDDTFAQVRRIVTTTGGRAAAGEYAAELTAEAKQCLAIFPPGQRAALEEIADYAAGGRSSA